MLNGLLQLQPKSATGGGKSREEVTHLNNTFMGMPQ
jgi:hypothetical protein